MSTFGTRAIPCVRCGAATEWNVVISLNGGRRPDLRQEILDDRFQWVTCPQCGAVQRLDEPFVYIDFERKQWITCFPTAREGSWHTLESEPLEDWKEAMITFAPPMVREWSAGFQVRAVFGLDALREKLWCFELGIDDVWLAVLELDAMRTIPGMLFNPGRRLRLVGVDEDKLVFRVMGSAEVWAVPRSRLAEIQAEPLEWSAAYDALNKGAYVDVGRILIGG